MELKEDIAQLIDLVHPGDSRNLNLEGLQLHTRFISPLGPNKRQIRLLYRKLVPPEPKATICICHGFAEHSGRYLGSAARLAIVGFEVHMIDLRSFGVSGGARAGHDIHEYQEDFVALLKQIRSDLPCFIWGHSMGGLIVTSLLINNPWLKLAGVLISAPLYGHRDLYDKRKNAIVRCLSPELKQIVLNFLICPSATSRDDTYLLNIFEDKKFMPLSGFPLFASLSLAVEQLFIKAKDFKFPGLWIHGDADTITDMPATVEFFEKVSSTDKTLKIYAGGYHEPHHDIERDRFHREITEWFLQRVDAPPIGQLGVFKTGAMIPAKPRRWPVVVLLGVIVYTAIAIKYRPRAIGQLFGLVVTKLIPKLFWPLFMLAEKLIPYFIK